MHRLNPEHFARLIPLMNQAPFFRLLNMKVLELGWASALVEMELAEKHLNPFGGVHGGSYTSAIDTAAYWSAYCQMDPQASFVTVDLHVDLLGTAKEGKLTVQGACLKMGRSLCLTEATVTDSQGRIIAHGNTKMMAIPGTNSIGNLVSTMGGQDLPPKFLD